MKSSGRFHNRLINDGWSFLLLPYGSKPEEAMTDGWKQVDLPHDWLISREDLYESAEAWYRRTLTSEETDAPVCLVRFDGVYMDCDILLNGELICRHPYGYTAFDADLTGKLLPGENELAVHIRHKSPNTRWYSGSGIFRDVTLRKLPENHIVPDSLYAVTKEKDGSWEADISVEVTGDGRFSCKLSDSMGETVAEAESYSEDGKAHAVLIIPDGKTWSPDHPELYRLEYTFGEQTESCRIGLRTTRFDPETGFWLNGVHTKLKGVCLHHDLGALGSAFREKAAQRQLRIMKEMGANALRTSHNPPAAKLLELCDEMGILVIDEAFDMWERSKTEYDYARFFPEYEEADVRSWIRRDRNHPSVIMWSIGNEISDMHADMRGTEVTRMLTGQVREHDPKENARVTFGCNYMPWEGGQRCAEEVGIPGYNYGEKLYREHHEAHPGWVIYGSETSSMLFSRGIYHFPLDQSILSEADLQCSALGNSNTSWGAEDLRTCIVGDLNTPFSMGQFIWSGIDYIGEPTPYHTRSCYFGQTDTACFPKDSYYLFQSLWTEKKMIHIGVSWDWNPGQMIDVQVMSNCDSAELFLNGKSLGRRFIIQSDPEKCLPRWRVPYSAGELRAAGYDPDGNVICEDIRRTPGDTESLKMTAEDPAVKSDGWDMTFVTVQAVDQNGNPVENARDRVNITVSGGGRLIGTDNGDSTDTDSYKSSCRRLFSGKLLLMIASDGKAEDIRITVKSTGGICSELTIPVEKSPMMPGISCIERIGESAPETTVPARKLEIIPLDGTELNPAKPECRFNAVIHPTNADTTGIEWQITNAAGIPSDSAEVKKTGSGIVVSAKGDGKFYLRALYGNSTDHPELISQLEISISGFGAVRINPYEFVSAGLYDLHEGDIGAGNEKGVAFSREGYSMVGFTNIDFGKAGSDTVILPVFALNNDGYDIDLYMGDPRNGGHRVTTLHYEKPSIWNVYQEETYRLPERFKGVKTLCFSMKDKVHLKGFRFEKQSRAWQKQRAADADSVYGDSFERKGEAVTGIGNNVSLTWDEMDFGTEQRAVLTVEGATDLEKNAISVRMENQNGESRNEMIFFLGDGEKEQSFPIRVTQGETKVTFVFLPGSRFDLYGFRFSKEGETGHAGQNGL